MVVLSFYLHEIVQNVILCYRTNWLQVFQLLVDHHENRPTF